MSDDESDGADSATMRALFVLTLAFVVAGVVYVIALGLLHR